MARNATEQSEARRNGGGARNIPWRKGGQGAKQNKVNRTEEKWGLEGCEIRGSANRSKAERSDAKQRGVVASR